MDQNLKSSGGPRASAAAAYIVEGEVESSPRKGAATYVVEAVVAAALLILGIVVVVTSQKPGASWTTDGPGSGYFPFYIGIVLCISGVGTLAQVLFGKHKNKEVFVDSEQLKRVLQVLVPAIGYVGAIQVFGIYVSSAV